MHYLRALLGSGWQVCRADSAEWVEEELLNARNYRSLCN